MIINVIDTETTGLDFNRHEVIQLGFTKLKLEDTGDTTVLEEAEYNFYPQNLSAADPAALRVNGFSLDRWKGARPASYYVPTIIKLLTEGDCMLGQNLIFDLKFLHKILIESNVYMKDKYLPYIDTKFLASRLVSEGVLKSSSMDSMCDHFNIKFQGKAHTALADCKRTVSVWTNLMKRANEELAYFTFNNPYDPYKNKG